MEKLHRCEHLPTAIMCSNDMTAIGVLHGLYRTTHKVPADISVVGFDDIHLAAVHAPAAYHRANVVQGPGGRCG
jgi:DNA-binding LacI/PurR family transcriptional regulator